MPFRRAPTRRRAPTYSCIRGPIRERLSYSLRASHLTPRTSRLVASRLASRLTPRRLTPGRLAPRCLASVHVVRGECGANGHCRPRIRPRMHEYDRANPMPGVSQHGPTHHTPAPRRDTLQRQHCMRERPSHGQCRSVAHRLEGGHPPIRVFVALFVDGCRTPSAPRRLRTSSPPASWRYKRGRGKHAIHEEGHSSRPTRIFASLPLCVFAFKPERSPCTAPHPRIRSLRCGHTQNTPFSPHCTMWYSSR